MRRLPLALCLLAGLFLAPIATARAEVSEKLEKSLEKLDPTELVTQVCDLGAMKALSGDSQWRHTDRVLIDAISEPRLSGNKASGEGGALRREGQWYRFSYSCTLSGNHMSVVDFRYKVGAMIPKEKWTEFGLWND